VHFDALETISLAFLTPPAFHIEAEAACFVASQLRLRCCGEEIADISKDAGVGRWITARCTTDGGLVDDDRFVEMLDAFDLPAILRFCFRTVQ
jgi:hypothetical protein